LPLQLPNLDDLRWKDLVTEGRSLIPASTEEWTNHNPSDPGITLIELFAYVSGTLMYQVNRITDGDVANFLGLINGPAWKRDNGLSTTAAVDPDEVRDILRTAARIQEQRKVVRTLWVPIRAVTEKDFETLTCAVEGVGRATCLSNLNLENDDPSQRWLRAPGHVSVVVLPLNPDIPAQELLAEVRQTLEPARLLTTRVHVVAPRFVRVGVRIGIVPTPHAGADDVLRDSIARKLKFFLDARSGGFDGKGWPLGRDLYVSELYRAIAEVAGVDSIVPTSDLHGVPQDEFEVDASVADRIVRDDKGTIQSVALRADELFDPQIEERKITVARHA
jgi:hypothetical protein